MSKLAGIYWDDTAAAPGISLSVYLSGCEKHCPGCHNPEAQDFDYGEDFTLEKFAEINEKIDKNGILRTLSILGGEPLHDKNLATTDALVKWIHHRHPETKVYIWTGYTLEELQQMPHWDFIQQILKEITCLIDGPYIQELRDTTLPLRGSSNQRIIMMEDYFRDK